MNAYQQSLIEQHKVLIEELKPVELIKMYRYMKSFKDPMPHEQEIIQLIHNKIASLDLNIVARICDELRIKLEVININPN